MSGAITNRIKTYFNTYIGKITSGSGAITITPRRVGENNVVGTNEEIQSDIVLPGSRIPSTPEVGTASNNGNVTTEWNIEEQDDLLEAAFCGEWEAVTSDTAPEGYTSTKHRLILGDAVNAFIMGKEYPQTPAQYQLFFREFVNQVTMNFATGQFVKLDWNFMGGNNPTKVATKPTTNAFEDRTVTWANIDTALTTKSFLTKKGWLRYADTMANLALDTAKIRQSPSLSISINNNLENTPALFEENSIEQSLGDFVIDGSFDVYNVDDKGTAIYNDAVAGADRYLQTKVERTIGNTTYSYTLNMRVHLKAPTESKNGNKLQFSVGFQCNSKDDLWLEKEVIAPDTNGAGD